MLYLNSFSFTSYKKLIPALACLFPIFTLAYGKGYKLIPIFLLLATIPLLFSRSRIKLDKYSAWLIAAFCFYFVSFAITVLLHSGNMSRLDGPSRFLLCIPIFIAILRYPPSFSRLSNSLILSAYIAGISAFILIFVYDQDRAFRTGSDFFSKGFMPIQSGNFAMTLGIMSLPITIYYLKKSKFLIATICSFGAAFGITASYLSGSRGGWVFVPVAIIYLIFIHRHKFQISRKGLRFLSVLILPTLLVLSVINLTPQMQQRASRVQSFILDMKEPTKENVNPETLERESSTGIRLNLWQDSVYTFMDYPFFGAGYEIRKILKTKRFEAGEISFPKKYLNQHSHNQYLEALSVQGLLGFFALIAIFFIPLFICNRVHKYNNSEEAKTIALCAALSIIMMMGYCLTQAIFRHNSGAIFYPLLTVILLGFALTAKSDISLDNKKVS